MATCSSSVGSGVEVELELINGLYRLPLLIYDSPVLNYDAVVDTASEDLVYVSSTPQGSSATRSFVIENQLLYTFQGVRKKSTMMLSVNLTDPLFGEADSDGSVVWLSEQFAATRAAQIGIQLGQGSVTWTNWIDVQSVAGIGGGIAAHQEDADTNWVTAVLKTLPLNTTTQSSLVHTLELDQTDARWYLGGLKADTCWDDYHWSERQLAQFTSTVTLFRLSVCSVDLFHNYTSNVLASIDTKQRCLVLPRQFHDHLMAWIPSECPPVDEATAIGQYCTVPDGVDIDGLPTLSFALQDIADDTTQDYLQIPLATLVDEQRNYCIASQGSFSDCRNTSCIVLGSMVLESLTAAFDLAQGRIGLRNQEATTLATQQDSAQCPNKVDCSGEEWLYPPLNQCLPPNCEAVLFHRYNTETKMCELNVGMMMLLCLVILGCLAVDCFNRSVLKSLSSKVHSKI